MPRGESPFNMFDNRSADKRHRLELEALARKKLTGQALTDSLSFIWSQRRRAKDLSNLASRLETKPDIAREAQTRPRIGARILSDEQAARLRADRAEGMTYQALSEKYGVAHSTAFSYCNPKEKDDQAE